MSCKHKLIDTGSDEVIHILVCQPYLAQDIQRRLLADKRLWVRNHLTGNSGITEEVKFALAQDPDWQIRADLVSVGTITFPIMRQLANDPCEMVRIYLAEKEEIPESVQMILAEDESIPVCSALKTNPNLFLSAREKLNIRKQGLDRK